MEKVYSAVTTNKNTIVVFDAATGIKSYTINVGNATIINGPVITKDKLAVVIEDSKHNKKSNIYSLKSGVLSYSFAIK